MAYIAPETNLLVLRGCPLDPEGNHTILFNSPIEQYNYFVSIAKFNFESFSYVRPTRDGVNVSHKADEFLDCNYIMFQNSAYGDKWFYAFLDDAEYINDDCTLLHFSVDPMQTWLFDFQLGSCFVEREHSFTDNIGDSITPEPVECGEYVTTDYSPLYPSMANLITIVGYLPADSESRASGKIYDGVFSGSTLRAFSDEDLLNAFLETFKSAPERVVCMYMAPAPCIAPFTGGTVMIDGGTIGRKYPVTITKPNPGDVLDGYKPKNNKLYTYPYCFYQVDNSEGNALSLRYEFFETSVTLEIYTTVTAPVTLTIRPTGYKGTRAGESLNTESLQVTGYPLCSWRNDSYAQWLAQNEQAQMLSSVTGAIPLMLDVAAGNWLAAAIKDAPGAITNVLSLMNERYKASIAADTIAGTQTNGNGMASTGKMQFYGGRISASSQYLRIIDDFFTKYGYSAKVVKVPLRTSRPVFNYVKTNGCLVNGNLPSAARSQIMALHDRGITYWHNPLWVGDYNRDNSPS